MTTITALATELARLRDKRLQGAEPADVMAGLADWNERRDAWWSNCQALELPLTRIADRMELSAAEVNALVVLLAPEVDPEVREAIIGPQRSGLFRGVTVECVIGLLYPSAAERFAGVQVLRPMSRLTANELVELVPISEDLGSPGTEVRLTEAVSNYLLGRPLLSGRAAQYCSMAAPLYSWESVVLAEDDKQRVWELVSGIPGVQRRLDEWGFGAVMPRSRGVVLLFGGPPGTGKSMFAHSIASELNRALVTVHTSRLVGARRSIRAELLEIMRVATLAGAVILIDDCEALMTQRDAHFLALLECLERHQGVLILTSNHTDNIDPALERRIQLRMEFELPAPQLRERIWEAHLPAQAPLSEDIDVTALANTYEFTGASVRNAVMLALTHMEVNNEERLTMDMLRKACDAQLRARLQNLAIKSPTTMGLDRLILPEETAKKITEVVAACTHREFVLARWGFGESLSKGRGLCILLDGPPGTGKTFAAELIAHDLKLPLYRVHIPNVVSKWVGETERNIAEIFRQARSARGVLLFDEADSLFGRRSSGAQSATDRYANMEINLLLQEIERYDGITFLTTNLFGNLDDALQRRIQFRVTFPFPEPEERGRIWRVLTPRAAPLAEDVDFAALGKRFELSGGHIKNALLRAAFRACDEGDRITQAHLCDAALAECQAQGKIVRELRTKK